MLDNLKEMAASLPTNCGSCPFHRWTEMEAKWTDGAQAIEPKKYNDYCSMNGDRITNLNIRLPSCGLGK